MNSGKWTSTYVHLPQGRWWYIVAVMDYYSRYLLTCFLTPFQNATAVTQALEFAVQESAQLHGALQHAPILVTDNGSCFLARKFQDVLRHRYRHVRIQYRTPQQLGAIRALSWDQKKKKKCTFLSMSIPCSTVSGRVPPSL